MISFDVPENIKLCVGFVLAIIAFVILDLFMDSLYVKLDFFLVTEDFLAYVACLTLKIWKNIIQDQKEDWRN